MRISPRITALIKDSAKESFGDVAVYLFGSRVDDTKRGGDIDIAVDFDTSREEFRKKKIAFTVAMIRKNFDLKIDIVPYTPRDELLRSEIRRSSVRL